MDYKRIYDSIVFRAKCECDVRRQQKKDGMYFERHHIKPKSIGGNNSADNLVLLTPREHFICHALLIRFLSGVELTKMKWAFFRLCSSSRKNNPRKCGYVNARLYEKFKASFQLGCNNSQYGKYWWVHSQTGQAIKSDQSPGKEWLRGRSLSKRIHPYSGKPLGCWLVQDDEYWRNREDAIIQSGVDLSKFGWVDKVAKCLGWSRTTIQRIYRRSERLQKCCYRRLSAKTNVGHTSRLTESEWKRRLDIVLECNIDKSNHRWKQAVMKDTGFTKQILRGIIKKFPQYFE